ncbi:hypothetical protein LIPSTDRAFT_252381 [Lipomyces starkeyi NRRL Y-11557]|uniref:Uncharacterized protein n=1 Tax=Lipomyces starkeyi NRRL Y-11557 TaxID=675824 RepID=A0A1E3Q9J0_LIPST|nr:hypothetical protein LIPSTDRAFT_252381 [Lipomyces starkeyi NRRL Y-11557]
MEIYLTRGIADTTWSGLCVNVLIQECLSIDGKKSETNGKQYLFVDGRVPSQTVSQCFPYRCVTLTSKCYLPPIYFSGITILYSDKLILSVYFYLSVFGSIGFMPTDGL